MQTTLLNEAWYNANKEAVHELNTDIPNLVPTQYDGLVGLRGIDVSGIAGANISPLEARGVSGTDDDGNDIAETKAEWSARVTGQTISNINKVKSNAPFNAFYLDTEVDLHMMKAMTGFPNLPEVV